MAVVSVDEVRASRRVAHAEDRVIAWQRDLIQALREASEAHDGRHLKLLGDGCLVAFEDPRAALAFADAVHAFGMFRIGIALGLIEEVEGELAGRTVFEAHSLMRTAGAGDVRTCAAMQAVCPRTP
jgi:class 3 adenylate cyclase